MSQKFIDDEFIEVSYITNEEVCAELKSFIASLDKS